MMYSKHGVSPMVSAPPHLGVDLDILPKFQQGGPKNFLNLGVELNLGVDLGYRGGAGRFFS